MAHAVPPTPTAPAPAPAQQGLRQPKSASKTEEEWDDQKENFRRLYLEEKNSLEVTMKEMEEQYGFKASYVS